MIERSEIFSSILRRNRLRLDNGLSPLSIREEFNKEVSAAMERDFQDHLPELMKQYQGQLDRIHDRTVSELENKHGKNYHLTPSGSYTLRQTVAKRFDVFLREKHGIAPLMANGIVYGSVGIGT